MTKVELETIDSPQWRPWHTTASLRASSFLEEMINQEGSTSFLERVAKAKFSYIEYHSGGNVRSDVSASEIRDIIRDGRATGGPSDGILKLRVQLIEYGACTRLRCYMGYTNIGGTIIHTNVHWMDQHVNRNGNEHRGKDIVSIAAHWLHEWMHVAGFRHKSNLRDDRQDVPYRVGSLLIEAARESSALLKKSNVEADGLVVGQAYEEATAHQSEHSE